MKFYMIATTLLYTALISHASAYTDIEIKANERAYIRHSPYSMTNEVEVSAFFECPLSADRQLEGSKLPKLTRRDAVRFMPRSPDQFVFEETGIVHYTKSQQQPRTQAEDIFIDSEIDELEKTDQCEVAMRAYSDLQQGRFTLFNKVFVQAERQHDVFGWTMDPLLNILLPQFAKESKQNNGHISPRRMIPAEFIQEEITSSESKIIEEAVVIDEVSRAISSSYVNDEEESTAKNSLAQEEEIAEKIEAKEGIVSAVTSTVIGWVSGAMSTFRGFWSY